MTLARGTNIMIKLSEIGVVVLAAGVFLLGCLLQPPASSMNGSASAPALTGDDALLDSIPQAELDAVQIAPLPNESGLFVAYEFKEKVTDRQGAFLLSTVIATFRLGEDIAND